MRAGGEEEAGHHSRCGLLGSTRWHIEQVYPVQLAPAAGTDVQKINTLDLQPRIWSTRHIFPDQCC